MGGANVTTKKRETGTLLGEVPYARFGNGSENQMIKI
jgi:hypothetical protein